MEADQLGVVGEPRSETLVHLLGIGMGEALQVQVNQLGGHATGRWMAVVEILAQRYPILYQIIEEGV